MVGYRFSPRFAVFGAYNYLLKKESEKSQTFNSQYMSGFRINIDASMEFTQRSIQLLGQFYPIAGSGLFLIGGMEFVSLSAEQNFIYNVYNDPYYGDYSYPWKAKGNDKTNGFILGGGFELPISAGNMALIGIAMYSTSKYDNDELLKVKIPSGVMDPNIDINLNVGGLMLEGGLRIYFNKAVGI